MTEHRAGIGTYLLFGLACLWLVLATALVYAPAWLLQQVAIVQDGDFLRGGVWWAITWVHGLLVALAVVPLALLTRVRRFRAVYQTWLLALLLLLLLGPVRLLGPHRGIAAVFAAGLNWLARRRGQRAGAARGWLPALALVPAVTFPWALWGALGSPLETALLAAAGLALGLCLGLLLDLFLLAPLAETSPGTGWDIGLGGLGAAGALLLVGSATGMVGTSLLLMLALPLLGFAVAGVARFAGAHPGGPRRAWGPVGALTGGALAAPMLFVDPAEVNVLLGNGDILTWALQAAQVTPLLAAAIGLGLWLLRHRINGPLRLGPGVGALALAGAALAVTYVLAGQPGFYGDRFFVILKDQADLSAATRIADRSQRLRAVYDTLVTHAERTQAGLRRYLDEEGATYTPYFLVNALEVEGGPFLRAELARRPEVDRIIASPRLRPLAAPVPPEIGTAPAPTGPVWSVQAIGADRVWRELGVTGAGIVVGQSDTGVQWDHPALRDGYRGKNGDHTYNWLDPWTGVAAPVDFQGHGTHALASAVGRGGVGVAPGATWYGCANLARSLGNPARYLDCMQFMLAPYPAGGDPFHDGDPTRAAHVINNSWGCPPIEGCDPTALAPAAAALRAAGIFVVVSAGNEGPGCATVQSPLAIYPSVFAVGAVDRQGRIAPFSSRGPVSADGSGRVKPDIVAPGVEVLSALPGGTYGFNSGTSMAGPHVAGTVALMWSANPRLIGDVERTEQILRETARPPQEPARATQATSQPPQATADQPPADALCGDDPRNSYGAGLLDAYAAVQAARAAR
jgi:subtilisin family serine protease